MVARGAILVGLNNHFCGRGACGALPKPHTGVVSRTLHTLFLWTSHDSAEGTSTIAELLQSERVTKADTQHKMQKKKCMHLSGVARGVGDRERAHATR